MQGRHKKQVLSTAVFAKIMALKCKQDDRVYAEIFLQSVPFGCEGGWKFRADFFFFFRVLLWLPLKTKQSWKISVSVLSVPAVNKEDLTDSTCVTLVWWQATSTAG